MIFRLRSRRPIIDIIKNSTHFSSLVLVIFYKFIIIKIIIIIVIIIYKYQFILQIKIIMVIKIKPITKNIKIIIMI